MIFFITWAFWITMFFNLGSCILSVSDLRISLFCLLKVPEVNDPVESLQQLIVMRHGQECGIVIFYRLKEQVQDADFVVWIKIAGSFVR